MTALTCLEAELASRALELLDDPGLAEYVADAWDAKPSKPYVKVSIKTGAR